MKLYYLANMRFPNEKAHGKQVKEMCNALRTLCPVTLLVPARKTEGDAQSFGLHPDISVVYIPTIDLVRFGKFGFLFTTFWFVLGTYWYLFFHRKGAVVLTREYTCALISSWLRIPTAWESHRGEWNWGIQRALHRGVKLVVLSHGLEDVYLKKHIPIRQILIAPDGVDLSRYQSLPDKIAARTQLVLPLDKTIVLYNGHLYTWKGAGTLAQAARLLPDSFLTIFMGGTDEDIATFKKEFGHDVRIQIIGRKNDTERPIYMRAADLVILPNSGKEEISSTYTSPLKLFGYMATGTPIVASDLPSIREILSEKNAFFAKADDPSSLAHSILEASKAPDAADRAKVALHDVAQYDWTHRAASILHFLTQ